MSVSNPTFTELVNIGKATLQGNTQVAISLEDGDPLLALLQANAVGNLTVVAAIQIATALSRAQTSRGAALDTWFAQFGFERIAGFKANGTLQLVIDPNVGATVPVGMAVASQQTSSTFVVVADNANTFFVASPSPGRYVYPIGVANVKQLVPIQSIVAGTASNVEKDTLTQLIAVPIGVVGATNPIAIKNGKGAESDNAALARFVLFVRGLHGGNRAAIEAAILGVLGEGASYVLLSNRAPGDIGSFLPISAPTTYVNAALLNAIASRVAHRTMHQPNFFLVVAENGSGTLTPAEIGDLKAAISDQIAYPVGFDVSTPTIVSVDVVLNILYNQKFAAIESQAHAAVNAAVKNYINTRKIAQPIHYSTVTHQVELQNFDYPGIEAVENGTIGGMVCKDYYPMDTQVVKLGTLTTNFLPSKG